MKVVAIFNGNKKHCSSFVEGKEYLAYDLLQCPPDSNTLYANSLVVIDEDGDAITSDDAYRIWDIKFEEV